MSLNMLISPLIVQILKIVDLVVTGYLYITHGGYVYIKFEKVVGVKFFILFVHFN